MIIRPQRRRRPPITDIPWGQQPLHPLPSPGGRPAPITDQGLLNPPPRGAPITDGAGGNSPYQHPYMPGHGGHHPDPAPGHNGGLPGHINVPGFTPDYQSLIEHDPYFARIKAYLSGESTAAAAWRDSQMGQAFINFGEAPQGYDPTISGAAANNPYSTLAQLKQTHDQNLLHDRNELAARGILQSGEYGNRLGNENRDYGQRQYDARQSLLDFINGAQNAFAQGENDRGRQLIDAGQIAYGNQSALPQNTPTDPFKANLAAQWGHGAYYKGADGKLYNQQGQLINKQQEIHDLRDRLQNWRQAGKEHKWIRGTQAWDALQYLLGSK